MKIEKIEKIILYTENFAKIEFMQDELIKAKFYNITKHEDEYFCDKAKIVIAKKGNTSNKYSNGDLFNEIIRVSNIQEIEVVKKKKSKKVVMPYDPISYDMNGTNSFQKAYLDSFGNLIIVVEEGELSYA